MNFITSRTNQPSFSLLSGVSATSTLWPSQPNCCSRDSMSTRSSSWTGSVSGVTASSILWCLGNIMEILVNVFSVLKSTHRGKVCDYIMCLLSNVRMFTMATAPSKRSTMTPMSFTCLFIAMMTATSSLEAEHLTRWVRVYCQQTWAKPSQCIVGHIL